MITGIGAGTVTSSPAGINCGATCDASFGSNQTITLTAAPIGNSVFQGWDTDPDADPATTADCSGTVTTCTITMNVARSVRPRFGPPNSISQITDFTPNGISAFLTNNSNVDTIAEFAAALPQVFRENWIMMTRSESLQTGTANYPRILLFNADATAVFTFALSAHASFPAADPLKVEYMQWDAADRNFRMHEITLSPNNQNISIDDPKCSKCHSTQNVLNNGNSPGTDGIPPGLIKVKNKPNWDTYDSWGSMLPFNRDRIYNGS